MEHVSPAFGLLVQLAQAFTQMLRERQPEQLDLWLEQASTSEFPELDRYTALDTSGRQRAIARQPARVISMSGGH